MSAGDRGSERGAGVGERGGRGVWVWGASGLRRVGVRVIPGDRSLPSIKNGRQTVANPTLALEKCARVGHPRLAAWRVGHPAESESDSGIPTLRWRGGSISENYLLRQ